MKYGYARVTLPLKGSSSLPIMVRYAFNGTCVSHSCEKNVATLSKAVFKSYTITVMKSGMRTYCIVDTLVKCVYLTLLYCVPICFFTHLFYARTTFSHKSYLITSSRCIAVWDFLYENEI